MRLTRRAVLLAGSYLHLSLSVASVLADDAVEMQRHGTKPNNSPRLLVHVHD
ncbi:secreted protein [Rhodopirellula baltica WH47]|uniref:Secreted protein n=1 Tax=Rhodopirellula baltica WH47 TaxID=991778 RepID=F2B255_RHOBT|nr:secreted protein [Rhodopirellula baltica WH47]